MEKRGTYVKRMMSEGLVEQIKKAISDDERYAEMRRKAYEFSSQFRTDRVKEYLIDFF